MLNVLLIFALLLLAAGVAAIWWGRRMWQNTGLPAGEVVYSDTGAEQAVFEPLVSPRYGLVGKPDYLVEIKGTRGPLRVPMEVKSRKRPATPAAGHILQLGAYCLIVEDLYGQRPTHGYLRYADATLEIPFTDALRTQVLTAARGCAVRAPLPTFAEAMTNRVVASTAATAPVAGRQHWGTLYDINIGRWRAG